MKQSHWTVPLQQPQLAVNNHDTFKMSTEKCILLNNLGNFA